MFISSWYFEGLPLICDSPVLRFRNSYHHSGDIVVVTVASAFDCLVDYGFRQVGAGGEIQLTDAMKEIAVTEGMTAVEMEGNRFDMGNKFGVLKANIDVGLKHPETKDQLKEYIKELAKEL